MWFRLALIVHNKALSCRQAGEGLPFWMLPLINRKRALRFVRGESKGVVLAVEYEHRRNAETETRRHRGLRWYLPGLFDTFSASLCPGSDLLLCGL
jgi:hypothetical protein